MKTCIPKWRPSFKNKMFSEPLMLHLWPPNQLSNSVNGKLPIQKTKSATPHTNNFWLLHNVSQVHYCFFTLFPVSFSQLNCITMFPLVHFTTYLFICHVSHFTFSTYLYYYYYFISHLYHNVVSKQGICWHSRTRVKRQSSCHYMSKWEVLVHHTAFLFVLLLL